MRSTFNKMINPFKAFFDAQASKRRFIQQVRDDARELRRKAYRDEMLRLATEQGKALARKESGK